MGHLERMHILSTAKIIDDMQEHHVQKANN